MEIDKPVETNVFIVEDENSKHVERVRRKRRKLRVLSYFVVAILVAVITFFTVDHFIKGNGVASVDRVLALQGKVELTDKQLTDLVVSEGLVAYWAGPEVGARYALTVLVDGEIYVRYLAGGKGLDDGHASYRVIGTYHQTNAFVNIQDSGKQLNSVGFINQDGDAVFYNKLRPTNLYIGLKLADIQVEVYDPNETEALLMATGPGTITRIA